MSQQASNSSGWPGVSSSRREQECAGALACPRHTRLAAGGHRVAADSATPPAQPEGVDDLLARRLTGVALWRESTYSASGRQPASSLPSPPFHCPGQCVNQTDIIQCPRPRNSPDALINASDMNKPTRSSTGRTAVKHPKSSSGGVKAATARSRAKVAAIKNSVIAQELAPAVAIAVLEKSEQVPGDPPAALDVLAAGASASAVAGNVRVQLMFGNGTVLPVEMSAAAGAALSVGLASELPADKKPKRQK